MDRTELQPQYKTFSLGLDFIERNRDADRWYLQIETLILTNHFSLTKNSRTFILVNTTDLNSTGRREIREDEQTVEHIRYMYASLVSFCDQQLGRVLDLFDEYNLWEDTMLLVNADHGFLMGEHDWWAKVVLLLSGDGAHPLGLRPAATRVCQSIQRVARATIDLAPTILDYFGIEIPADVQGGTLSDRITEDKPFRKAVLYGVMGGQVNNNRRPIRLHERARTEDNTFFTTTR